MGFTISYKILFEVKILHHYFLNKTNNVYDNMTAPDKADALRGYDVTKFISIQPTPETAALLSKNHCVYRSTATGLIVGLQSIKSGTKFAPAFPLSDDLRFTFTIRFEDVYFTNYTALPLLKNLNSCYYLQNRKDNSAKKFPFLTQFPAAFTAGTYSAGDIISDDAANPAQLFVAKKLTTTAAPGADWTDDPLVAGKPLQYLTKKDLLDVHTGSLRYNTGQTALNLTITITNRWGDTIAPKFETTTDDDKVIALVDLHLLPEDFYTIKLEDAAIPYTKQFSFYHLQYDSSPDVILDLTLKSDDAAYNMTDGSGFLREPVYELRFSNRFTTWRYLGEKFSNKPEVGPHPLTKKGIVDVSALDADGKTVEDLANPNIRMIKTEHPDDDNQHYNVISEIYIH